MDRPSADAGESRDASDTPVLDAELASIQEQIDRATTGYQPNLLTRAADACAEAGAHARALAYYGQAIDGYLATGRHHAASAVCRKILQLSPTAVRAHCTLAWLALAREDYRHAIVEIRAYVQAARAGGQAHLVTRQLTLLAKAAPAREVREAIGLELLGLAPSDESEALVRSLWSGDGGGPAHDASDIWSQALAAVKLSPYDLKEQSAKAGSGRVGTGAPTLAEALRASVRTPPALREVLAGLEQAGG